MVVVVGLVRRACGLPSPRRWELFLVASAWLAVTTLLVMGHQNDWVTRVSMPALFVFRLAVASLTVELWCRRGALAPALSLAVAVLVSAERPLKAMVLAPFGAIAGDRTETTIETATRAAPTLAALPRTGEWDLAGQYLGSCQSTFSRYLARLCAPVHDNQPH
jgi:hypothetical protein